MMTTAATSLGGGLSLRLLPAPAAASLRAPVAARRQSVATPAAVQQHVESAHHTERLLDLANEFTHHWIAGVKEGPTAKVLQSMASVSDDHLTIKSVRPLGKLEFQGMDGLRDMLLLSQHREGGLHPTKALICATNDDDDTVFCLMESEAELDLSPLAGSQLLFSEDKETMHHRAYGLVKFDTLLDDTSRCVTALTERWQLAPADMRLMSVQMPPVTAAARPANKEPEQEARFKAALEHSGAAHFPHEHIRDVKKDSFDVAAAKRSMEKWCLAHSSGQDEKHLLSEVIAQDFRLWDAMGVLPMLGGMKPTGGFKQATAPKGCVMASDEVLNLIHNTKAKAEVTCALLDKAVCTTHNIGFVHWRSYVHPAAAAGEVAAPSYVQEGLEMHVFSDQGKIMDTWMLRDPMKAEQEMLLGVAAA